MQTNENDPQQPQDAAGEPPVTTETAAPPPTPPAPPKPGRGGRPAAGLTAQPGTAQPPLQRKASEGRIVHYVMKANDGSDVLIHRAAIVTRTIGAKGRVDLSVFIARSDFPKNTHPGALLMIENVTYDETGTTLNTWHWPEHV